MTNLPLFESYDSILVVVNRLTKMADFIPYNKTIINKKKSTYFLIMFFDIMDCLKILFLIMNPSLHPSFGRGFLNY